MTKNLIAELIGTFWLVLGGCGSAVLAANFGGDGNPLGIGLLGRFARIRIDGSHWRLRTGTHLGRAFQSAVSAGLWAGGRFPAHMLLPYVAAQTVGAVRLAGCFGRSPMVDPMLSIDPTAAGAFATNGFGIALSRWLFDGKRAADRVRDDRHVPGGDHGATQPSAPAALAPVAIGLALTLIHRSAFQ
jgi:aquaporin Z